jgi:hypothetical protein
MGVCNKKTKSTTKFNQMPLKIGAMNSYWEQSITYLDGSKHHLKLKLLDKKNPISEKILVQTRKSRDSDHLLTLGQVTWTVTRTLSQSLSRLQSAEAAAAAAAAAGLGSVTRSCLGCRCSSEQFVIQMTKTITY